MQNATTHTPKIRPLWASPAGKSRIAAQLVKLLPQHTTYVEPFAGSAAVLYAKPPSAVEVVSDIDTAITAAFWWASRLPPKDVEKLVDAVWVGSKAAFQSALMEGDEGSDTERLRRFLYLAQFSFLKGRRHFNPAAEGKASRLAKRIPHGVERLRNINVESGDYEAVVRKYDGPETVFFFDPPYVGANVNIGERDFDELRFFKVLKSLKGRFLLTYGGTGNLTGLCKSTGFNIQQHFIKRNRQVRTAATGRPTLATYVIANYELPDGPSPAPDKPFAKSVAILKSMPQERYLLGIVLEPEVIDAHGDIYGAVSIRQAAHDFMERHQTIGKMHTWDVSNGVKIIENYLMPADAEVNGQLVRQGTWMLGVRILDNDIWEQVLNGELTGFSVGGSATRTPVDRSISNEVA